MGREVESTMHHYPAQRVRFAPRYGWAFQYYQLLRSLPVYKQMLRSTPSQANLELDRPVLNPYLLSAVKQHPVQETVATIQVSNSHMMTILLSSCEYLTLN